MSNAASSMAALPWRLKLLGVPDGRLSRSITKRQSVKFRAAAKHEVNVSSFEDVERRIRGIIDAKAEVKLSIVELSSGFCNSVYSVETDAGDKLVVKVYSDLSLLRTEKHQRGVIDVMASESNLGPAVRWNTNEGIAHDFVHGRILEENDMHTLRDVGEACAKVVAKFHSLETPPEFDRDGPLLWKWLERMLNQIESSENTAVLPVEVSELRAEVNRVSTVIRDDENACVVLAHGDLKPSNVILTQSDAPEVQLIDLELSGPNYRGFDLMKLFRTSPQQYSEERLRHFLKVYCDAMNVDDVARVEAETKLFLPVTWLEATVFFALVLVLEPQGSDDHEKWEALFLDRWRQYQENAKDLGL